MPETCICAAIKLVDGTVIQGLRHHLCLGEAFSRGLSITGHEQGFITSTGRFVDRLVGKAIQNLAGLPSAAPGGYRGDLLYSEDLY